MSQPLKRLRVSVLISTYNRADLLPEAIDSLLNQTRPPDEIIVVDDGSTDNTPEVLAQYGNLLRVIRQENRGLPVGRNVGIQAATGDVIAFLDSDDTLHPKSIERRVVFLETHPEIKAVYTGAYMTTVQHEILGWFRTPPLPKGNIFAEALLRPVFPMHAVMFHRDCIKQVGYFKEELRLCLDFDYWIRFAVHFPFEAIEEPLAYYRVHDAMSISVHKQEVIQAELDIREKAFSSPNFDTLSSFDQARVYSVHATQLLFAGNTGVARLWYRKAITTAPTWPRPYLLWLLSLTGVSGLQTMSRLRRRLRGEALEPI